MDLLKLPVEKLLMRMQHVTSLWFNGDQSERIGDERAVVLSPALDAG